MTIGTCTARTCTITGLLLLWIIPAAAQPSDDAAPACTTPEARQFDFWIGDWNIRNQHRNPGAPEDPTWFDTGAATDRVYAILDGCAVVEHWMGRLSFATIYGFSVRAYDPEKEKWVLVLYWPGPQGGSFGILEGAFQHGRGAFFNDFTNTQGQHVDNRFTFSDITPSTFRWDSATSTDGMITWKPGWIMAFTRRDPLLDGPLFNGPTLTDGAWCQAPEGRAFDFMEGAWTGKQDEAAVTMQAYRILNGCAVMDFVEVDASPRPYKRFRVRAYDATLGQWVQYAIDNRSPTFERAEGSFEGHAATLTTLPGGDVPLFRETWSPGADGTIHWARETSTDGGTSWAIVNQVEWKRLP